MEIIMGIKGVTLGQNSSSSSFSDISETATSGTVKSTVGYVVVPVSEVSGYFSGKEEKSTQNQIHVSISDRQSRQLLKIITKYAGETLGAKFYRSIQIILPRLNKSEIDSMLINYGLIEKKGIEKRQLQLRILTSRKISNYVLARHAEIAQKLIKHEKISEQTKSESKSSIEVDKSAKKDWSKVMTNVLKKVTAKKRRRQKKISKNSIWAFSNQKSSSQEKCVASKGAANAVDSKKLKKHTVTKSRKNKKTVPSNKEENEQNNNEN